MKRPMASAMKRSIQAMRRIKIIKNQEKQEKLKDISIYVWVIEIKLDS